VKPQRPALEATPLSEIAMRSIEYVERPIWQRSAFQLLAGPKGAGKGTYLAGLAARMSGSANVLVISSEDSAEIDLKPRLVAAGAVIDRCHVVKDHVRLPDDVEGLRTLAVGLGGVGLLVIDPVANHIGDANANSDAEVRNAIAPLNALADELDCLLIGVRHPGKDRSRGALVSILGSTAWVDTPRAVVMIAVDNEDPAVRHIQVVAGNRSLNGAGQAFRIAAAPVEGLTEPITLAVPLGESSKSVEELLDTHTRTETKTDRARELILDILDREGAQESDGLDARVARETRLAVKTVKNARTALKDEALIRNYPDKDEAGTITRWKVSRTLAPRPAQVPSATGTGSKPTSLTHSVTGTGLSKPNQNGNWSTQIPWPESTGTGDGATEAELDEGWLRALELDALGSAHEPNGNGAWPFEEVEAA
jgi:hypothetical protein